MAKTLILCSCEGSQTLDAGSIAAGAGVACSRVHEALCTRGQGALAAALEAGDSLIACAQETALVEELCADMGLDSPPCIDLRDRAGWSDEAAAAGPKMAALVAEALLPRPAEKTRDVVSGGMCLILGDTPAAARAAERLEGLLSVTRLLPPGAEPPMTRGHEAIAGRLRGAAGSLGRFELSIDALSTLNPAGRGALRWSAPKDGARSACDVILDLTGDAPLFPAHEKRDGYLRADPKDADAVLAAVLEASQSVGTFEKTLHVALDAQLCAHARAGRTGCTRCLDACPTGAIRPDGEHVTVDPLICAGCGACSSLCPSGAIRYDAPPVADTFARIRTLAEAYAKAGGEAPRLLIHDPEHGAEMISLAARFHRGLPADVIPLAVPALAAFGHAEMLAALAGGFAEVRVLLSPKADAEVIGREAALAAAMSSPARIAVMDEADPEAFSDALYAARPPAPEVAPILALGDRRQVARLAARALNKGAEAPMPLPAGAPYGAVEVNTDACTLCLSCASLCPSGALGDNPDAPQLRFTEDACLQCGICASVCPEDAISLLPRFDPTDAALRPVVLHEEEPAECIRCGKEFGVKSTIEKIVAKLAGAHPMFADPARADLIRMCDDCRVKAQFHAGGNPLSFGEKPRVRTSDDYFAERTKH